MVVDESMFDGGRHFAGCREDGARIALAPQLVELPEQTITAILAHEFGHAVDGLYPAEWEARRGAPAAWLERREGDGRVDRAYARLRQFWAERSAALVELAADSIAHAIVGHRVEYCGPCLVQCWSGGIERPDELR